MKKILIYMGLCSCFCILGISQANTQQNFSDKDSQIEEEVVHDTIIQLGGRKIACNILNVGQTIVYYHLPGKEMEKKEIARKQIQSVRYKSGRIEEFNKPVFVDIEEGDWKAVFVTEKQEEVAMLYRRGAVVAESSPTARNMKAAKRNATIMAQKRAANMMGNVVLIEKAEAKGGFGDPPAYTIQGIVYSFEPPKPGEPGYSD